MKTYLLLGILSVSLVLTGVAQTQKGQWTLGTQIGSFTYQNQNGGQTIAGSIAPSAGYFIADGLVLGTGIPISLANQKSTDDNSYYRYAYKTFLIGLAPFVRYYIGKNKLKPYVGVAYSYSRLTLTSERNDMTGPSSSMGKGKTTSFVPTLGVAYFINPHLALTAGLNYTISHQDQETTTLVSGYSPSLSSASGNSKVASLNIGFQLFIGK